MPSSSEALNLPLHLEHLFMQIEIGSRNGATTQFESDR
jgi:hypothetical protein